MKDKDQEKNEVKGNQQTTTGCNPEDNWKNHGAYVSCMAKVHFGGQKTSEAAKSDIGKKKDEDSSDDDEEQAPTPSASPISSPTPSTSPSASASASASPAAGITESVNIELKALVEVLSNILQSLQKLI